MEKLSIKSLQIGDLVIPHVFDSKLKPSKIVGIHYNSYKGKDYVDWVDCEAWDELHMDEIEPIPLTPEILEKIGFKEYNGLYGLDIAYGVFVNADFKVEEPFVSIHNTCYRAIPICRYLHQLQHALRLCGIEITIKL